RRHDQNEVSSSNNGVASGFPLDKEQFQNYIHQLEAMTYFDENPILSAEGEVILVDVE
ncbi:hypothetical protein KI387_019239, partial [Taxus chinensis]